MVSRNYLVLVAALAMFAFGTSAALAGGGNSAGAKECQKNAWQSVQTNDGITFADEEACTSYTAQGGVLFSPALVPNLQYCLLFNGTLIALYGFTASGFHANSAVIFQRLPDPYVFGTTMTDANGVATFPGALVLDPFGPASMTATDAQGTHSSVEFTATCV
jgi:hypothetical protein